MESSECWLYLYHRICYSDQCRGLWDAGRGSIHWWDWRRNVSKIPFPLELFPQLRRNRLAMVAPLYISEIAPPEIRGTLLVLQELSIVTGIVIAFYITYGTRYIQSQWAWRLPFLIQIIPALFLVSGVFLLPYSPRWLAQKGRDEESLKVLAKIRQLPASDSRIQQEWYEIRAEVAYRKELAEIKHPKLVQNPTRWNRIKLQVQLYLDCWKLPILKRTNVGVGLMFFQQFVGINALIVCLSFP